MQSVVSPVSIPAISISFAPPEEPIIEPQSPFAFTKSVQDDGYRPQHLTPPLTAVRFPRQSSPLRPADCPVVGGGLDSERFNNMLKTARERQASIGMRKVTDLRKELAIKNHKSKQAERRALFLSKVQADPSPTAGYTSTTSPQSPALFRYTDSPGLGSPPSLFESAAEELCNDYRSLHDNACVKQLDLRLPKDVQPQPASKSKTNSGGVKIPKAHPNLPSLDCITARMSTRTTARPTTVQANESRRSSRLPAFLQPKATSAEAPGTTAVANPTNQNTRPQISIGRLHMPLRASSSIVVTPDDTDIDALVVPSDDAVALKLGITTIAPRTPTTSSEALCETNLDAFGRAYTARDMLSTIRRRTPPPGEDERKVRRNSAPAELPERAREGFKHAVLAMPGGF